MNAELRNDGIRVLEEFRCVAIPAQTFSEDAAEDQTGVVPGVDSSHPGWPGLDRDDSGLKVDDKLSGSSREWPELSPGQFEFGCSKLTVARLRFRHGDFAAAHAAAQEALAVFEAADSLLGQAVAIRLMSKCIACSSNPK